MVLKIKTTDLRSEQLVTPSEYAGLGAAITAKLMNDFWFGVRVMSAVGVADCLNHFVRAVTRGKMLLPIKW